MVTTGLWYLVFLFEMFSIELIFDKNKNDLSRFRVMCIFL
jgi:hypothetical protein